MQVGVIWVLDTLDMVLISHTLYWYLVTNYGNPEGLSRTVWCVVTWPYTERSYLRLRGAGVQMYAGVLLSSDGIMLTCLCIASYSRHGECTVRIISAYADTYGIY